MSENINNRPLIDQYETKTARLRVCFDAIHFGLKRPSTIGHRIGPFLRRRASG